MSLRPDELLGYDALGLAELVRSKAVQPIELVDLAIARIEALNPNLNAIVTPMCDRARDAAQREIPAGPFRGVPFLLKDLGARVAGVRMTSGSKALSQFIPDFDSELVIRHRRAGLITVAKTNTPEFGLTPTTEPELFGPTRNPWDLARTPGGSSGGSAAAVAARIVPIAHANDGGGSIRIPASCCGVFGLKPTRARNPLGPDVGDVMSGLVVEHAVSLSVRDSAALLDATEGDDAGSPYSAPPKARPFLDEVSSEPGRLRIAFSTKRLDGTEMHPDCAAATKDAARLLESLGHHVEEASPAIDARSAQEAFAVIWWSGTASTIEFIARLANRPPAPEMYEPLTWETYQRGKAIPAWRYLHAVTHMQALGRYMARFHAKYDLWLTPCLGEPPPKLGELQPNSSSGPLAFEGYFKSVFDFVPFAGLANMTGQPAMSVPLYWNGAGLPIGLHFFAPLGNEAILFRLAAQLERARPWMDKLPAISAARNV